MGKVTSGWIAAEDDEDPEERKRRLRKELDQIRKNALGRKRDLRCKDSIIHKPKSSLIKTLNHLAPQRRKIEDATQITHLISKPKPRIIKQEVIQPRDLRGFFRAGIKGKELTLDPEYEKYKNGVLQSDALQILHSDTRYHSCGENQQTNKSAKSPIEDDHRDLKMEVAKILKNLNSSASNSLDLDDPGFIEFPTSPVISRNKGVKKKVNQVKVAVNGIHKNFHSQENEFPLVNNANKGERYRRRLFDEVTAGVNNNRNDIPNNVPHNSELSRHSTPDNVIFYSEFVSKQPAKEVNKKHPKLECSDPDLIKYYVKICKFMGMSDLKNMFRNKYKDPEEKAKEALKLTYKRVLKEYVNNQNCRDKSTDQTTPSSNSEILQEPDSDIARRVKKNEAYVKQKQSTTTPSNSTESTKNFVNKVNARSIANTIEDNMMKRKRAPSSKGSGPEVPSSTQAIADPKSVRADSKMNSIHPDRQELVARFLEDQKSFTSEASQQIANHHVRKEKLYINSDSKGNYFVQKSTKYVPAILRKNRSLADCVAKEKATILSIENYPGQKDNKSSILDFNLDNIESERTPNSITEPLLEAPKCKYVHKNAKYNQPSRINIPIVQENRHQRHSQVSERHSQRYQPQNSVQSNFTMLPSFNLSPIKQHSSYADASHDFHLCQLSQESKVSDKANGMIRMVSFGDIQDRTNRLTLCSQNQNCSQENMEHAYASQHSHSNYHYQPCESTSNHSTFKNQSHVSFVEPSYDRANHERSSSHCCRDRQAYVAQNEYQVIPQNDYSFNEPSTCGRCHQNNSLEIMRSCAPPTAASQAPVRQPVKYYAAEGRGRQAIYNPNESCSFGCKQPCCSTSRGDSSDFEYLDMLKMNYRGGGGDRPQSYAPPNGNQRYMVQRQMPSSPPVYQQASYRHSHRNGNEAYKMNDPYLHQMNRQMHSKRQ